MFDNEDENKAKRDPEYYYEKDGRTYCIPPYIRRGLDGYAEHGQSGGFIRAAVQNDFATALGRADSTTLMHLRDIHWYIQNELPGDSHGSPEIVKAYADKKRKEREKTDS